MKPRMAFIGVRSSWLTLARNSDFAWLARASEAFVAVSRAASACWSSNSWASRSLVAFTSRASPPSSSRFGTSTRWLKSSLVIEASALSIFRTGRMNAHDSAKPRLMAIATLAAENDDHDDREQGTVVGECGTGRRRLENRRVDQLTHLGLENVGCRVLLIDV